MGSVKFNNYGVEEYDARDPWQHNPLEPRSPLRNTIDHLTRYGADYDPRDVAVRMAALQLQVLLKLSDQFDRIEQRLCAAAQLPEVAT
jgi:hypothetical protein